MTSAARQRRPVLVNPVIAYGYARLKNKGDATLEDVCDALLLIFEDLEFRWAKDALWQHIEEERGDCKDLLGEKPQRNSSKLRTAAIADCQDLLKAIQVLDDKDALPRLAVGIGDLLELPPITPQHIQHKRQAALDQHVSVVEEELHQSQDAMRETLASIQEAQQKMAKDLAQLQLHLARSDAQPAPLAPPPSPIHDRGHSTPRVDEEKEAVIPAGAPAGESEHRKETPWNTVRPPRRRRTVKVVTGTETADADDQGTLRGALAVGSLFVFISRKDSTDDAVRSKSVDVVNIRMASHPDSALKSFKVTVSRDNVSRLMHPDFPWPLNVKVRRFVPRPLRPH